MSDSRTDQAFRVTMYAVLALAAALYIAFIYAYPLLFSHMQKADPQNYQHAIEEALAGGDTDSALNAARNAAAWFRLDPDVQTRYGELLLDSGATHEARRQFEKAVSLTTTPAPESRSTRLPYFHPVARLALGELDVKRGDFGAAIAQFELARPLAPLDATGVQRFGDAAATAYAHAGVWSRVLEYLPPTPDTLASLDREDLVALIAAAEGGEAWAIVADAGRALLAKDTGDPSGHYGVGRAMVAEADYGDAIEPLRNASKNGHHDSSYFLGVAHQTLGDAQAAITAYRDTPPESLYRVFSLAAAIELMENSAEAPDLELLRAEMQTSIDACCPIALTQTPSMLGVLDASPISIQFATPRVSAAIMPVLVRWRGESSLAPAQRFALETHESHRELLLRVGSDMLHLQWVKNHLPLSDFESTDIGSRHPGGWIDPAVAWAKSRELSIGVVEASAHEAGHVLSITTESAEQRGLLYSIPLALHPGAVYAVAGRMRAPDTKAVFGWEFLGEQETVIAGGNAVNQRAVPEWSWQAAVTQAQYPWKLARVVLGLYQASGTAAFDDVVLLELKTPTP